MTHFRYRTTSFLLFSIWIILLFGGVRASEVLLPYTGIDVTINGKHFSNGGLIVDDRTYVSIDVIASGVGGRATFDHTRQIAMIGTGTYESFLIDHFLKLNPNVARMYRLEHLDRVLRDETASLYKYSAPGASLDPIVTDSGEILGFKLRIPADTFGHYAWFDQAEGEPINDGPSGLSYTQHLFVVDPSLVEANVSDSPYESSTPRIAMNGQELLVDDHALRWIGDTLWVRLRTIAEQTGGGVGWDPVTRTASAKIVPGPDLTIGRLFEINETRDHYRLVGTFVPGVGYYYDVPGPGITVTYDSSGRVVSFATLFDLATTAWQPWFDQPKDRPEMFPTIGPRYSIHHYVMPYEDIRMP